MSHTDQNQTPQETHAPMEVPPPVGYPTAEGSQDAAQGDAPAETQTRGDGFLKGCCAALCCCCVLDACF
ncbi:unnamed protein product [Rhodiola kirilowii]